MGREALANAMWRKGGKRQVAGGKWYRIGSNATGRIRYGVDLEFTGAIMPPNIAPIAAPATITKGAKRIMDCHDQPWLPAGSTAKIPNMIKATVEESAPMPMALNTVALASLLSAMTPTIPPIRAPANVKKGARKKISYPDHAWPAAGIATRNPNRNQATDSTSAPMTAAFNTVIRIFMSSPFTTVYRIARNLVQPCSRLMRLCAYSSATLQHFGKLSAGSAALQT